MNLQKELWTKGDIEEFQNYLKTLANIEKKQWATNILNTKLPVLVIKTPKIKQIIEEISSGNFLSFLDFMVWEYYENTAINGFLICKIKDFDTMVKYLNIYSDMAENWATCDLLSFNMKNNEQRFFDLALKYSKSDKPFVRRIGLNILFKFVDNEDYIDKIFDVLNGFYNETHYYVNMVNAWLICDCFIKQRKKTIKFFEKNNLNKFTQNKAIQKCRDSYRVSADDKQMLLKFKVK